MKLVKSLLLGSAAGLAAVASAQAADLPTRKAAPAEYVRVCDAYGAGFFFIPGTQTCLRISGRVRADYVWQNTRRTAVFTPAGTLATAGAVGTITPAKAIDSTGMYARGRVNFDARTQTSWGTLRTYIRYEITSNSGAVFGNADNALALKYAFIQFAGVTAGRAQSFFDFYAEDLNWGAQRGSDANPTLLAYTATFGGGFSATISIEDKTKRGSYIASTPGGAVVAASGHRLPDLVGALRLDQGWGSAQLSGAVGQRNNVAGGVYKNYTVWAVQGGLKFNLPMLAAGDYLWLQAAYSDGAARAYVLNSTDLNQTTGLQVTQADAIYRAVGAGYAVDKTKGWGVLAAGVHYWTPSFRQTLWAGYTQLSYNSQAKAVGWRNQNEFRVGSALIWSPVKDFDIGLELLYAKTSNKGFTAAESAAITAAGLKRNPDSFQARLRLQRDF